MDCELDPVPRDDLGREPAFWHYVGQRWVPVYEVPQETGKGMLGLLALRPSCIPGLLLGRHSRARSGNDCR